MIKFKFDEAKFKSLMQLLCKNINDIDRLKAVKLLYFIDKDCLLRTGRPILGDIYFKMYFGPVPSQAYDFIKEFDKGEEGNSEFFFEKNPSMKHPLIKSKHEPDLDVFSEVEMNSIRNVIKSLGKISSEELSNLTHEDCTWKNTRMNAPIDYRLFFKDDFKKNKFAFEAMLSDQEANDFLENF